MLWRRPFPPCFLLQLGPTCVAAHHCTQATHCGRGLPTTTTTSPTPSLANLVGLSAPGASIQLPPAPVLTHHAPPVSNPSHFVQALPTSLALNSTEASPAINHNVNTATPAALAALAPAVPSTSHVDLDAAPSTMLDAQAIQAQVEALIQSTSSSVVANSAVDSTPIAHNSPSISLATAPSAALPPSTALDVLGSMGAPAQMTLQAPATLQAPSIPTDVPAPIVSNPAAPLNPATTTGTSFQNTFAQYQYPQNHDRALKDASIIAPATTMAITPKQETDTISALTREEEERAADALIADNDNQDANQVVVQRTSKPEPFSGADLAAAAKAIGIEADVDLLDGMGEDQRALAAAIRRLGNEHGEAAEKAISRSGGGGRSCCCC